MVGALSSLKRFGQGPSWSPVFTVSQSAKLKNALVQDCDIGDHGGSGSHKIIYVVEEPKVIADSTLYPIADLHYTWNVLDTETLMIDPKGNVILISKVHGGLGKIAMINHSSFSSSAKVHVTHDATESEFGAVLSLQEKGGDLQQDPAAASTVKHQNTRCKNTKDEYSTRRKRDTRHVNIKHKRLHINRRDQWVTGADFGRPFFTQVANGVVILDYVRTTLSLLQLPRGLEERTIVV
ncbi:hypothetical protein FSP39_025162 [Pinctada imbricata]|uniref:Uncharacterized protein n=1 Tax=Pinctada imbricata TaxID=66713 RepID=A0AA88XXL2_PINIB|nr:hypothetical protein FSP39_025162 [Pinctada imbricata]